MHNRFKHTKNSNTKGGHPGCNVCPRIWPAQHLFLLVSVITLSLFSACSKDDDSDFCCEEVTLHFRYVRTQRDEFKDFIKTKQHFLFDGNNTYVREVTADSLNPQRIVLHNLADGNYTMLTIANYSDGFTALTSLEKNKTTLADLRLALAKEVSSGGAFEAAEELFWNSCRFEFKTNEKRRYICDMANIHCHLFLKVEWEDIPPNGSKKFTVELANLTSAYQLQIDSLLTLHVAGELPPDGNKDEPTSGYVVHQFPRSTPLQLCTVRVEETLRGHELFAEIRTLRYLNDRIPTIQLLHDGKKMFNKPIDLTPIFHDWGWFPNLSHEQKYSISLKILRDKRVVVKPWGQPGVMDWVDGGSY